MENVCEVCSAPVRGIRQTRRSKTCSRVCTQERAHRQYRITNPRRSIRLAPSTVGAAHELAVSVDLMRRGFPVFRALSPACVCDLIAIVDGEMLRVEVCGAYRTIRGRPTYPKKNRALFDILALVFPDGRIEYEGLRLASEDTGS